jgi:hypothetical protein
MIQRLSLDQESADDCQHCGLCTHHQSNLLAFYRLVATIYHSTLTPVPRHHVLWRLTRAFQFCHVVFVFSPTA